MDKAEARKTIRRLEPEWEGQSDEFLDAMAKAVPIKEPGESDPLGRISDEEFKQWVDAIRVLAGEPLPFPQPMTAPKHRAQPTQEELPNFDPNERPLMLQADWNLLCFAVSEQIEAVEDWFLNNPKASQAVQDQKHAEQENLLELYTRWGMADGK